MSDPLFATEMLYETDAMCQDIGQTITIRRITKGALDANPTKGYAETPTNYTATAVVGSFDKEYIQAGLAELGDKRLVVSLLGLAITPTILDTVLFGTDTWHIIDVMETDVGGTPTVTILHVRR